MRSPGVEKAGDEVESRRCRQVHLVDLQAKKRRRVNFQRLRRCRLVVDMDALIRVPGLESFSIRMDLS